MLPLVVQKLRCPRPLHLPFLVMSVTQVEFSGLTDIKGQGPGLVNVLWAETPRPPS